MRIRTRKSAIPVLAILLLGLILPLMISQVKARILAPIWTSSTGSQPIPAPPAPTATPSPVLATFGQYLPVIAAVIVLAAVLIGLFIRKRKHPSTAKN